MLDTLLLSYKIEYETTPITIEEMCTKYQLQLKDLKGHKTWSKSLVSKNAQTVQTAQPQDTFEEEIQSFKFEALHYCRNFMEREAKHSSPKEVKDVVAIIAAIEPKQQAAQTTNVNVLVQNLTERFKDDV